MENDRPRGNLQRRPRVSLATQGRGGRRRGARAVFLSPRLGRAPWAGVFGAPFGAHVLRGDGASRAPGGEARAPRPSRARSECQFLQTSRPGAGPARRPRPGAVLAPRPALSAVGGFRGFQPNARPEAFYFCSSCARRRGWARFPAFPVGQRPSVSGRGGAPSRGREQSGKNLQQPSRGALPPGSSAQRVLVGWPLRGLKSNHSLSGVDGQCSSLRSVRPRGF